MGVRCADVCVTVVVLVCFVLYHQVSPVAEPWSVLGAGLDSVLVLLQGELVSIGEGEDERVPSIVRD